MRKILLYLTLISALGMLSATAAQAQQWGEPARRWLFELGAGGSILSASEGESVSAFGVALGIGYYVTPRSYVELDFGIFSRAGEQIGTFDYTKTVTNSLGSTTTTHHDDGVIKRRFSISPVMLTWAYEFPVNDKFIFKLGPTIGSTTLTRGYRFVPDVEDKPELPEEEIGMFSAGVTAIASWIPWEYCSVDFSYRALYNSPGTFMGEPFRAIGNNLKLTLVMRFGR